MAVYSMGKSAKEVGILPWPSNASVTKITFDGEKFELLEYSTDHFMGALATRLPDNVKKRGCLKTYETTLRIE